MAGSGDFELEVREQPQWARLRALEAKLELQGSLTPPASSEKKEELDAEALADVIELRVMSQVEARLEAALEEVRTSQERVELKVSGSIAPTLQRLSSEQAELRK